MDFKRIVLASQSPRRREMITWLGLPVRTASVDLNEDPLPGEDPAALAARLARDKARAAGSLAGEGEWILAADTVVALDGRSLGKPQDAQEARAMLHDLRGRAHYVHTGVALYAPLVGRLAVRCVTTKVWMREYTDAEIDAYVASGDPMDKAGAYAIQNAAFHPVERIECCYANVVGLPLHAVAAMLEAWGLSVPADVSALCRHHFDYRCAIPDRGLEI